MTNIENKPFYIRLTHVLHTYPHLKNDIMCCTFDELKHVIEILEELEIYVDIDKLQMLIK